MLIYDGRHRLFSISSVNFNDWCLLYVKSSVVQGSCVGPLLFSMFINDLHHVVKHCELSMFADDLKAAGDSTTPEAVAFVQSDLDAISQWAAANELLISLPKGCTLHYGARSSRHQYILGGQPVASVSECVDLGVLRSDCFSYQSHVRAAALKAARLAGMVMRMFASRDKRFLCKLFCAYVRPLAEYAAPVWSPDDVKSSVLLENIQRRFTKRIAGMSHLSYEERLRQLQLQSLQQRRNQFDRLLVYKSIHGQTLPPSALGLEVRRAITRGDGGLKRASPHSALLATHFCCRAPKAWSALPQQLKNASTLGTFKKRLLVCKSLSE